jgi:[amino group carrier protein]-L-2-aminoadipate 6-kinase
VSIVVKIGGAPGNTVGALASELVDRRECVLVHGGSAEVDRISAALGVAPEYFTSPSGVVSRRSDARHLEAVVLGLAGKVQTDLVATLGAKGIRALGLSGVDGRLVVARRKTGARARVGDKVVHLPDELSGAIERVDGDLLRWLLGGGILPVVGPPAVTDAGEVVNVDADQVAASVAVAIGATDLILLTNVPGLLRDPTDPGSLLPRVAPSEIDAVLPLASGRMRKKLLAARQAVSSGVGRAVIAPSTVSTPIASALAGHGTVIA